LPNHPFDPVATQISKDKPLIVGWNEDEFNFFGMMSKDKSLFSIGFDELPGRLKPQFGEDTQRIIDTYRKNASGSLGGGSAGCYTIDQHDGSGINYYC
jgi:para-nitrobenzyl esterase